MSFFSISKRFFSAETQKIYTSYNVFNKNGNKLSLKPLPPRITQKNNDYSLTSQGGYLLDITPRLVDNNERFDYNKTINIRLYATDVSNISNNTNKITIIRNILKTDIENDITAKSTSIIGKKNLIIKLDNDNVDINITTTEGNDTKSLSVTLNKAEYDVMTRLMLSGIPKMFMWEAAFDPIIATPSSN